MPLTLQAAAARQSALASCSSRGVAPLSPAPRGGPANGKLRRRSLLLMPPAFASAAAADSSSSSPPPSDWDRTAVVIVDHGSRKAEANAELEEFATLYRRVSGRPVVEIAHMELASPSIDDAVSKAASLGAARVVLAPYFLSRGRHVREDIPALAKEAAEKAGLPVTVAEPFGVDELLAAAVEARVASAEERAAVATAPPPG